MCRGNSVNRITDYSNHVYGWCYGGQLALLYAHTNTSRSWVWGMKGTGDLYAKICDMENLRQAHIHAKKGKGWYAEVKQVERNLDSYLRRLQESLIEHTYKTSPYETFEKKEGDKVREIYKLPYYPDRICQ